MNKSLTGLDRISRITTVGVGLAIRVPAVHWTDTASRAKVWTINRLAAETDDRYPPFVFFLLTKLISKQSTDAGFRLVRVHTDAIDQNGPQSRLQPDAICQNWPDQTGSDGPGAAQKGGRSQKDSRKEERRRRGLAIGN